MFRNSSREVRRFDDWDFLRMKQLHNIWEQRPGRETFSFVEADGGERFYQIELFRDNGTKIRTLIVDYRIGTFLRDSLGVHPVDARDLEYGYFGNDVDEYQWYPHGQFQEVDKQEAGIE